MNPRSRRDITPHISGHVSTQVAGDPLSIATDRARVAGDLARASAHARSAQPHVRRTTTPPDTGSRSCFDRRDSWPTRRPGPEIQRRHEPVACDRSAVDAGGRRREPRALSHASRRSTSRVHFVSGGVAASAPRATGRPGRVRMSAAPLASRLDSSPVERGNHRDASGTCPEARAMGRVPCRHVPGGAPNALQVASGRPRRWRSWSRLVTPRAPVQSPTPGRRSRGLEWMRGPFALCARSRSAMKAIDHAWRAIRHAGEAIRHAGEAIRHAEDQYHEEESTVVKVPA